MRIKQATYVLLTVSALFLLAIGFTAASSAASEKMQEMAMATQVSIDNFSFGPADLTVPVGTTVTWTNKDDVPHNVVSNDKLFASPVLDTDEQFSFTFKKAGTFGYYCSIHPKMTAKVIVK
jgi:plastocyanin